LMPILAMRLIFMNELSGCFLPCRVAKDRAQRHYWTIVAAKQGSRKVLSLNIIVIVLCQELRSSWLV
jgi:hypothetical protein